MSYAAKGYEAPLTDYIAGKYRIVDTIGAGSIGAVYEVEHAPLDRIVAIYRGDVTGMSATLAVKVINSQLIPSSDAFMQSFESMMKVQRAVNHPNVVRVHDYGIDNGSPYIVMPYLGGARLRDVITARAPLTLDLVWEIMQQVCSALSDFHSRRIFHLALSSDNIILQNRPEGGMHVQVLDLGLAGLLSAETRIITVDEDEGIVGVPRYIAPEQVFGADVDARADIYALGAMLYDLLVGKVPFNEDLVMQTTMCHLNQYPIIDKQFTPAVDLPDPVKAVVLKCLDLEVKKRFQSIIEFVAALHAAIEGISIPDALVRAEKLLEPVREEPEETPRVGKSPSFPPVRRRRIAADAILAGLVCLSAFTAGPFVIAARDALFPGDEELLLQQELKHLIEVRKEAQRFFDILRSEQATLERKISDLRAELALKLGTELPAIPEQRQAREEAVQELKTRLDIQQELMRTLTTHVFEKSETVRRLREQFEAADALYRTDRMDEAVKIYPQISARFKQLDKQKDKIYRIFALKLAALEAERQWQQLPSSEKPDPSRVENEARQLRDNANSALLRGDFDEAQTAANALLSLYREGGGTDEHGDSAAEGSGTAAAQLQAESTSAMLANAERLRDQGQYAEAAAALKDLVERDPNNARARVLRGNVFYNLRRFGEAVIELKEALKLDPESAEGHYNLANSYLYLDRLQEARTHFEQAVRLDPKNATAFVNLGVTCQKLGDRDAAQSAFNQALKIDPNNKAAASNLKALKLKAKK